MRKKDNSELFEELEEIGVTSFGYELIRETLLPDILGKEHPSILYWAGKSLARKIPLHSMDEIRSFFIKASWGDLALKKETKDTLEFELSGKLIENRLKRKEEASFQLEAGFLAVQIQQQKGYMTEASESKIKKTQSVLFTVKWDTYDPE